jgi:hypothetical protein
MILELWSVEWQGWSILSNIWKSGVCGVVGQVKDDHISLLPQRYSASSLIPMALCVCARARLLFHKTIAYACKLAVGVLNRQNAGQKRKEGDFYSEDESLNMAAARREANCSSSVEDKNM